MDISEMQIVFPVVKDAVDFMAVGSRVTCDPPPRDTDTDCLVLVRDLQDGVEIAKDAGFCLDYEDMKHYTPNEEHDLQFVSLRNGVVNLLITDSEKFFDRFKSATLACKYLNLMDKSNRVALFRTILYHEDLVAENEIPLTIPHDH